MNGAAQENAKPSPRSALKKRSKYSPPAAVGKAEKVAVKLELGSRAQHEHDTAAFLEEHKVEMANHA